MLQGSAYPVRHEDNYAQFRDILQRSNENYLPKQNMSNYQQWAEQQIMSCSFTHYFSQAEKDYFFDHIKIKHYFNGQTIYRRQEMCHEIVFVLKGTIKMSWNTEEGRHVIHKFIPSGILLNIIYFMSGTQFEHDYVAHEATVVAVISGQVFQQLLKQNSQVLYQVFDMICKRNRLLDNDLYHRNTQDLRSQLARQFIYLMESFSSQTQADVMKLNIRISQENFAELLNVSRKTIKKELIWFVEQGIIETRYNQIYITDANQLKTLI